MLFSFLSFQDASKKLKNAAARPVFSRHINRKLLNTKCIPFAFQLVLRKNPSALHPR